MARLTQRLLFMVLFLCVGVMAIAACGDDNGNGTADTTVVDTQQDVTNADTTDTQTALDTVTDPDTTVADVGETPDGVGDTVVPTDVVTDMTTADVPDVSDMSETPDMITSDTGNADVTTPPDVDEELLNVPDIIGCEVELRIRISGTVFLATLAGNPVPLTARLRNLTDSIQVVTMDDPCPNGVAYFSGLPAGYDYYQTCTAGACMGNLPPKVYTLNPKEELIIADTIINAANDPCNQPLPQGTYKLLFTLPLTDDPQPNLCGPAIEAELTIE